jgi:hypothetical protein
MSRNSAPCSRKTASAWESRGAVTEFDPGMAYATTLSCPEICDVEELCAILQVMEL